MEDFVQTPTITTSVLEIDVPHDKKYLADVFCEFDIPKEKEIIRFQLEFNNISTNQVTQIIQNLPESCVAKMSVEYIKEKKGY